MKYMLRVYEFYLKSYKNKSTGRADHPVLLPQETFCESDSFLN